jgi:hypothetical protein
LDLPNNQKMVWFIDCWNVHCSSKFQDWMKEKYPNICLLFVPTNCTSKLQPCDVILHWHLKCAFASYFKTWSTSNIYVQLEANTLINKIDLQMDLPTLCEMVFIWLWNHMYIWAYIKKWLNMDGSVVRFLKGTFMVGVPKRTI